MKKKESEKTDSINRFFLLSKYIKIALYFLKEEKILWICYLLAFVLAKVINLYFTVVIVHNFSHASKAIYNSIFQLLREGEKPTYLFIVKKLLSTLKNEFFGNGADSYLLPFVVLRIGRSVMSRVLEYLRNKVYPKLKERSQRDICQLLLHKDYAYFLKNETGTIVDKLDNVSDTLFDIIHHLFFEIINLSISVGFTICQLMGSPWYIIISLFLWIFLHLSITVKYTSNIARFAKIYSIESSALLGKITDCVNNIFTVKVFAGEEYENSVYLEKYRKSTVNSYLKFTGAVNRLSTLLSTLFNVWLLVILLPLLGFTFYEQSLPHAGGQVASLEKIITSIFELYGDLWEAAEHLSLSFEEVMAFYESCQFFAENEDFINLIEVSKNLNKKFNSDLKKVKTALSNTPSIEFINVNVVDQAGKKLIDNMTFKIEGNQSVGLVGKSGSGKSTIIYLLLGLREYTGTIKIAGLDIKTLDKRAIRAVSAVIPQNAGLLERTVQENVTYGYRQANSKEVRNALDVGFCDFVSTLSSGLDFNVGKNGSKLSGGQQQRLAIARAALLDSAKLAYFDEATSAVDPLTEIIVSKSLEEKFINKMLVLMVAHRLSTIKDLDRIFVIDEGKIVEDGSFNELLLNEGKFYKMWKIQERGVMIP